MQKLVQRVLSIALIMLLCGCNKPSSSLDGKALAAAACIRCHTLPSPSQLPPEEWPYMLAWMGAFLGHPPDQEVPPPLLYKELLPAKSLVTTDEFQAIRAYFLEQSRVQHKPPEPSPKPAVSSLFQPFPIPVPTPIISMVAIDPLGPLLVIGSSRPANLLISGQGKYHSLNVPSEPISYERIGQKARIALIGHLGSDARAGGISDFDLFGDTAPQHLITNHHRISAHRTADVDGDGREDLFICGFGDTSFGRVGIWWNNDGKLTEQILLNESGATWGDAAYLDNDNDLDLIIALGHARPKILAFINEGNRRLTPRVIVDRPVGWGYNRCALADWDNDGDLDLIECSGNNLELGGRPVKAHHGIRILRNEGAWNFKDAHFEPLPGAIDIAAGDFNRDGRIDLAAVAFYPDWRQQTPPTLLLLTQKPDGSLERSTIGDTHWNRWMRISAGDADSDGDLDLLLGAAQVPMGIPAEAMPRYVQLLQNKPPALLLRNQSIP